MGPRCDWFTSLYATSFIDIQDEAREHFANAERLKPDGWKENRQFLAKSLVQLGEVEEAVVWLERAAAMPVKNPDVRSLALNTVWYSDSMIIDSPIIRFRMRLHKKTSRRCCHSTGDHPDPGWNCGPSTKRVKRTGRTKRERTLGVVNSHHSIDNGDESCCDTYQKWDGLISSCYDTRLRKVAICLESYSNFAICNFIFRGHVKIGMPQDVCPFFDVTGLQLITRYPCCPSWVKLRLWLFLHKIGIRRCCRLLSLLKL